MALDTLLAEPQTVDELQQAAAERDEAIQSCLTKGVKNGHLEALQIEASSGVDQPAVVTLYVRKPAAAIIPRGSSPLSRVRQPFRSPARLSGPCRVSSPATSLEDLHQEIRQLRERLSSIEQQVYELSRDHDESDLQLYIDKLHDYNEIKDTGQILVGKMAELSDSTTSLLYEQFGLDQND